MKGITSKEAVTTIRELLDKPIALPDAADDSNEKLIAVAAVFLSMDDRQLLAVILSEANNRLEIGKAVGKHPWELT